MPDQQVTSQQADEVRRTVLVTATELAGLLDGTDAPVLLDVRWALGDPNGRQHYTDGHLPGARYVDLDTELASHGAPTDGRHPLPSLAVLQDAARSWGIRTGDAVVLYDNSGGTAAGRGWWLLRWAGLPDVRLLDGGLAAWTAAGLPVESGEPAPAPAGDVVLTEGNMPAVTADGVLDLAQDGILLDARAGERYRGEVEPVDPRAGHIPGAINAPTGENLAADGTFLSADELRTRFEALGVKPGSDAVGVYCGSGVTASHEIAALASIGVDAVLFPGSFSAWSSDEARPVAVGEKP